MKEGRESPTATDGGEKRKEASYRIRDLDVNMNGKRKRRDAACLDGVAGAEGGLRIFEGMKEGVRHLRDDQESKVFAEQSVLEEAQQKVKLLQKKLKGKELELLELRGDLQSLEDLIKLHGLSRPFSDGPEEEAPC